MDATLLFGGFYSRCTQVYCISSKPQCVYYCKGVIFVWKYFRAVDFWDSLALLEVKLLKWSSNNNQPFRSKQLKESSAITVESEVLLT